MAFHIGRDWGFCFVPSVRQTTDTQLAKARGWRHADSYEGKSEPQLREINFPSVRKVSREISATNINMSF